MISNIRVLAGFENGPPVQRRVDVQNTVVPGQFQGDVLAVAAYRRIPGLKADNNDVLILNNWHCSRCFTGSSGEVVKISGCKLTANVDTFFKVFANHARFTKFAGTLVFKLYLSQNER